jgi:hypothetical protein
MLEVALSASVARGEEEVWVKGAAREWRSWRNSNHEVGVEPPSLSISILEPDPTFERNVFLNNGIIRELL